MRLQHVPIRGTSMEAQLRRHAETLNAVMDGKSNVTGDLTLTASSTTTVVNDNKFESQMVPLLIPTSANAAAALSTTYVSGRGSGNFTLTHANNSQTDRTFLYVRLG